MFDRQHLLADIIHHLSIMEVCLKWHSGRGENDACKTAEDVIARFLAKLCGWDLVNLNTIKTNYPAADLGDFKQRIAVQVTVNGTSEKVRATHDKASAHGLSADFDRLIILFLLPSAPSDPGKKTGFKPCTSPAIEKWARPQIDALLAEADTGALVEVLTVLKREMSAISAILRPSQQHRPHNLPYISLGTLFKGRDSFLASLRRTLAGAHPTVIRGAQAIHGMGGVGKTRAAVEYAWQHEDAYNALLFLTADSPDALTRNLAALCGPMVLNLPEHTATDTSVQVHAVLHWLRQHPGWFLIIDNVDTQPAQDAVADLLTHIPHGHIVITSRIADWPAGVTALDLDVLSEESSIAFLIERTDTRRIRKDTDRDTAKTIAAHLDCLALALEQCAAYIRARRCAFSDYLRDWESKRAHVLAWHDAKKSKYPCSIAVTYETSVSQLSEGARTLFRILSWLAPDPMPLVHLEQLHIPSAAAPASDTAVPAVNASGGMPDDPTGGTPVPHSLLIELTDLHLATLGADGATFSIHRLLQEITRQQQPGENPPALLIALGWLNDEMPTDTDDVRTWPIAIPLVPHALTTATFAAGRAIPDPTARLLNCAAILLKTQANYRAAEPHFRRAIALMEKAHGKDHPNVTAPINNLAQLLKATNRLAEAEPLLLRMVEILENKGGEPLPNYAAAINNLAQLLQATNRLAEAEPLMRRALAIDETSFGKKNPIVAIRLNNLATLLKDTNRMSEAEPLMRRVVDIFAASHGENHPNVATAINNLALLLQDTNRLAEAEPLMRRALAIDEASFGKGHPDVARDLNNLALLLKDTNRLSEAEPLMRRALAIDEAAFSKDHPAIAIRLNNLAQLLKDKNRLAEAEPLMRRGLAIEEDSKGKEHPHVAIQLNNLAQLLQATNRISEAEPLMKEALRILEESLGREHPNSITVRENLEILQKQMKRQEKP